MIWFDEKICLAMPILGCYCTTTMCGQLLLWLLSTHRTLFSKMTAPAQLSAQWLYKGYSKMYFNGGKYIRLVFGPCMSVLVYWPFLVFWSPLSIYLCIFSIHLTIHYVIISFVWIGICLFTLWSTTSTLTYILYTHMWK